MRVKVDFYRQFHLEKPLAGLVKKIISPKGNRTLVNDIPVYRFKSKLCGLYQGKPMRLSPGLYHVSCVCKLESEVVWNHYLFVVEHDKSVYPIAEYLKQTDSTWVKDGIKVVKKYFDEIAIEPIKPTRFAKKSNKATSWGVLKK